LGKEEALQVPARFDYEVATSIEEAIPTIEERPAEATDPACGMRVEIPTSRHSTEYGGETYYFCGPGCKRTFEGEPPKYATDTVSTR
jgi:YHS domain-containing protein